MSDQIEGSAPADNERELLMTRARMIGVQFSNNIGTDTLRDRVNAKLSEIDDDGDESEPAEATPPAPAADAALEEVVDTEEGHDEPAGDFDADIPEEAADTSEQPNGFDAAAQIAAAKVTAPPTSAPGRVQPFVPVAKPVVEPSAGTKQGQATNSKAGKRLTLRQHLYNEQMKLVRVRIQNLDPKKADLNGEVLTISNKYLGNVKMFVPYGEVTDDGWHIPYIIYKELERRRFLNIRTIKDPKTKQPVVKKNWAKEFALDVLPPLTEGELKQLATAQAAAGSIDSGNNDLL